MLRQFRVRAWCLTTVLCLAVSTAGASLDALVHERDTHDACCSPAFDGAHDAAAHRYQQAGHSGPPAGGHHCVVCHSARTFRPGVEAGPAAARLDDAGANHPVRTIGRTLSPALANLPARSPPQLP